MAISQQIHGRVQRARGVDGSGDRYSRGEHTAGAQGARSYQHRAGGDVLHLQDLWRGTLFYPLDQFNSRRQRTVLREYRAHMKLYK